MHIQITNWIIAAGWAAGLIMILKYGERQSWPWWGQVLAVLGWFIIGPELVTWLYMALMPKLTGGW